MVTDDPLLTLASLGMTKLLKKVLNILSYLFLLFALPPVRLPHLAFSFLWAARTANMSLTALPSELIFEIADLISRTAPKDIEDFGRSCRRVRGAAIPLIKEHRKLLRQYTKLHVNNAEAAKFLYEISKRPWVAFYPHSLEVSANRNWRTLEKPRMRKQINIVEEVTRKRATITDEDLEDAILRTGFISAQDTHVWVRAVDKGEEDYLFALLLASLPNLNRFTIRLYTNKMEQVKEMVRAIKREWPRRQALPNLRAVDVIGGEEASECDLEAFPLLAAIPGVQNLRGSVSDSAPSVVL